MKQVSYVKLSYGKTKKKPCQNRKIPHRWLSCKSEANPTRRSTRHRAPTHCPESSAEKPGIIRERIGSVTLQDMPGSKERTGLPQQLLQMPIPRRRDRFHRRLRKSDKYSRYAQGKTLKIPVHRDGSLRLLMYMLTYTAPYSAHLPYKIGRVKNTE